MTAQRLPIEAVLFDVGGVLMLPLPQAVRGALIDVLPRAELPTDAMLHRAHYVAMAHYDASADRPEVFDAYRQGFASGLGIEPVHARHAEVLDALEAVFARPSMSTWIWPEPEGALAMARLAAAGVPIGVVSNADGTVESGLLRGGVCQVGPGPGTEVVCIVDSGVVGAHKPDPACFAPALDALAVDPERIAYVGDSVRNDVVGARNIGMQAVLVDPYGLHPPIDGAEVHLSPNAFILSLGV